MGRISREVISQRYGPLKGKLICPDGREYQLNGIDLEWTTEYENTQDGPGLIVTTHRRPVSMVFRFGD